MINRTKVLRCLPFCFFVVPVLFTVQLTGIKKCKQQGTERTKSYSPLVETCLVLCSLHLLSLETRDRKEIDKRVKTAQSFHFLCRTYEKRRKRLHWNCWSSWPSQKNKIWVTKTSVDGQSCG